MKKVAHKNRRSKKKSSALCTQIAMLVKGACVLEVLAPKAGNVHPNAAFADTDWTDFVRSAAAIAPVLSRANDVGLGRAILAAVQATKIAVGRNTNLGIILLLAPLCAAAARLGASRDVEKIRIEAQKAVQISTLDDSSRIFDAISHAKPGGLGKVEQGDVTSKVVMPIHEAMALAAERDLIAREWTHGFPRAVELARRIDVYFSAARSFEEILDGIAAVHVEQIAHENDTLIVRKCGEKVAAAATARAKNVIKSGLFQTARGRREHDLFDRYLRADGNRRNPGTTADLIAAALFIHLWSTR